MDLIVNDDDVGDDDDVKDDDDGGHPPLFCPSPGAEAEFYHPFTRLYRSLHCIYNWPFGYNQVHLV